MPTGKVRKTYYAEGEEIGLIEYEKGEKLICYILELTENRLKCFSEGDCVRFDTEESVFGYKAKDIEKTSTEALNFY